MVYVIMHYFCHKYNNLNEIYSVMYIYENKPNY